jgi:hypothetical protein
MADIDYWFKTYSTRIGDYETKVCRFLRSRVCVSAPRSLRSDYVSASLT